ncbi:MAG: 6-phosphofructokinase 2 [Acetobacteraceae bacterium]|jgi:6-phosphofructokinase 2|nr:6-phosphofructokinase 2 [Acetobacteraceae bacterium]
MPAPIVTLTLNPAVDLSCMADAVRPTHKIRTSEEQYDPGGGGINVARVIHSLGGEARALVLTGGATGRLLAELLDEAGVAWQALPIRGRNRISLNVHERGTGLEYRFVPAGPRVDPEEWGAALQVLETVEADWIVASGSLPVGVPADFYARAAAIATRRGQKFALDTSGAALRAVHGLGIALLKLSLRELESLAGHELPDDASRERGIEGLIRAGTAARIAVSLGQDGALLGTSEGILRLPAMQVEQRGAVGAGDSFLAGLVLGLSRGLPDLHALAFGNAAGAAAVTTYGTARVRRADVDALYREWCRG